MTDPGTECWVFDVDASLIDSLTGTSLRPGTHELLGHLRQQGHRVLLWSAGGDAYALRRAKALGIDHYFEGFFTKDTRDEHGRYHVHHLPSDGHSVVVFVDDQPQDLPLDATFVRVSPYLADNPYDKGLRPAAERAGLPASDAA